MKGIFAIWLSLVFAISYAAKPKGPGGCFSGLHHHHHHLQHFSPMCMGTAITIPDDMKMAIMECHNKTFTQIKSAKEPPSQEQRACDIVCSAQGTGLLDKDGKPVSRDVAEKIIVNIFPKELTGKVMDALSSCTEKHGKNLMIKENDCGSYTNLIECIITIGRQVCGISPPPLF